MNELVIVYFIDNHPNGFPGGSPEEVSADYDIDVFFTIEGKVQVSGDRSNVLAYLEDYSMEDLLW